MKTSPSSSDVTAAASELRELEKHIEKARRLLNHLEHAVVKAEAESGQSHGPLNAQEERMLTLLRTPTKMVSADEAIDLCEINAQLVEAALFMQAENERAEQNQLRQSRFLTTFAHELRNPLSPIRNAAALLEYEASNPKAISEVKSIIEEQVAYILRLLNDLLDLARVEAGKLILKVSRINLTQLVDDAITTYSPVFAKREQKINKFLLPNVFAYVDSDRFSQILNNLLDNAAKYTPVKGTINISVSVKEGDAELKITDNGIGISKEVLPHIFELYLQDTAAREINHNGLGIGLAVVQELTRAHGGEIVARSEGHGRGSEFIVTIPHAKVENTDTQHAPIDAQQLSNSSAPATKNKNAPGIFELQNQVAEDQMQIAALEAQLMESNYQLLSNNADLRSANEKLVASAMRAQIEADEAAIKLQQTTETMNADLQARSNQNRIDFISRCSHELRTPLNAILGFGQLMLHDDDDHRYLDPSQRERLENIQRAGQQLLDITNEILATKPARLETAVESVELLDVIGATLSSLEEKRQERKVQWQWIFSDPCCVWGDATKLQSALHDVISYALQNSVVGGVVEGSIHRGFNTVSILIGYQDCSVWPSIAGSPQSELLAAKSLLGLMQGTLAIHHPMQGVTALQIILKLHGVSSESKIESQRIPDSLGQEKTATCPRILYIEDNPVNAMVMAQVFAKQPQWRLSIATNGAMGLEIAASTQPSLILLDMDLGDMTGLQVFSALKSANLLPPLGCIALSANVISEHVKDAMKIGFTDYWTKPLNVKLLVENLHLLLDPKASCSDFHPGS